MPNYSKEREIEIKVNRALRKLKKVKIKEYNGIELRMLHADELFDLYLKTFDEPIATRSRKVVSSKFDGYVYIIGNLDHKVCKIGFAKRPLARLSQLQTGCPYKLVLFKEYLGNIPMEKRLHKKYEEYKLHGEWFEIRDKLKKVILTI